VSQKTAQCLLLPFSYYTAEVMSLYVTGTRMISDAEKQSTLSAFTQSSDSVRIAFYNCYAISQPHQVLNLPHTEEPFVTETVVLSPPGIVFQVKL